ncbi:MAG: general secretion pathway protein H [Janthinobacterium sp.]|jgi:general secretion pathway protein H
MRPAIRLQRQRGFTLIELLVVMAIIGVTLGLVSLNAIPSQQQTLEKEAQRIALLLQLARDEAIVRSRQVAFEADPERYRFLVLNEKQWQLVTRDDLLRERAFKPAPMLLTMDPPSVAIANGDAFRIIFGREPVDKPFLLTLSSGAASIAIRADGIGHFYVE